MMKKKLFSFLICCISKSCWGFSVACVPYTNATYSVEAHAAAGTLTKSQTCDQNIYTITSTINLKKGFFSKTITQTATGTYTDTRTISAQTFTSSEDNYSLPKGSIDPLSLVLYLTASIDAGSDTFSVPPLFYNGKTIAIQCITSNATSEVMSSSGATIIATTVTCATPDKELVLTYQISKKHPSTMLTVSFKENGQETLSAKQC